MSCGGNCGDDESKVVDLPKIKKGEEKLSLTKEAAQYVLDLKKKEGHPESAGLRIEVMPGGCAGYKYFMAFQEKAADEDTTLDFFGLKVFLSPESTTFMQGSTIEYTSSLEGSGIKINNPNATRGCACGKSFS